MLWFMMHANRQRVEQSIFRFLLTCISRLQQSADPALSDNKKMKSNN
ncbi:hypothetical protein D1BOALGB6SA_8935 [Olavius sp. associated proteobacterium Delta 1]|nr:hypothetical protein D1BOALGB6SA_8935 [Olavius sp. associated proteobacterium Delta 1]